MSERKLSMRLTLVVPAVAISCIAAVALRTNPGRAEPASKESAGTANCLSAPNATSPEGSHWYYRIDRANNNRRCWYLAPKDKKVRQSVSSQPQASSQSLPPPSAQPVPPAAKPMERSVGPRDERVDNPRKIAAAPDQDESFTAPNTLATAFSEAWPSLPRPANALGLRAAISNDDTEEAASTEHSTIQVDTSKQNNASRQVKTSSHVDTLNQVNTSNQFKRSSQVDTSNQFKTSSQVETPNQLNASNRVDTPTQVKMSRPDDALLVRPVHAETQDMRAAMRTGLTAQQLLPWLIGALGLAGIMVGLICKLAAPNRGARPERWRIEESGSGRLRLQPYGGVRPRAGQIVPERSDSVSRSFMTRGMVEDVRAPREPDNQRWDFEELFQRPDLDERLRDLIERRRRSAA